MAAEKRVFVSIRQNLQIIFQEQLALPLLVGRQEVVTKEPAPVAAIPYADSAGDGDPTGAVCKLITHDALENKISRRHLVVEWVSDDQVRITNRGNPVYFDNNAPLDKKESRLFPFPSAFSLGDRHIRIEAEADEQVQSLNYETIIPGATIMRMERLPLTKLLGGLDAALAAKLVSCFEKIVIVLQSAATEEEILHQACESIVNGVGLDFGAVMFREGPHWSVRDQVQSPSLAGKLNWTPSRNVMAKLAAEAKTLKKLPSMKFSSLDGIASFVVSPILDEAGKVIGALYGDRRRAAAGNERSTDVTELEAMLNNLVASAVAVGVARIRHENVAQKRRQMLEQFFTPALARELETNDKMLQRQKRDVTLLVCDIRGFSSVAEKHGAEETLEWLSDVMDELGKLVIVRGGVLVDQVGDEFLAMFGAPTDDPRHAQNAIDAAADILRVLPELSAKWENKIGAATKIGIGIHSGEVIVGNTGFRSRFRYAPLGPNVNLASRVQGASKYFRSTVLVTGATAQRIDRTRLRRLGKIGVVNIEQPVDVYELSEVDDPMFHVLRENFEEALALFEANDFEGSIQKLGALLALNRNDRPTHLLMGRASAAQFGNRDPNHPVWRLEGK